MTDPELLAHREWLGYVQPVGVVVSPPALLAAQAYVNRNVVPVQERLLDVVEETENGAVLTNHLKFLTYVLGWEDRDVTDAPVEFEFALPEYGEVLRASYAVREPESDDGDNSWLMLLKVLPTGDDLDTASAADDRGWSATPEAKFERLLREAQVPIGILLNGTHIRLVYAPRGETSGYLTFPVAAMTDVAGRPILAALEMLLCAERLFSLPAAQRLPAILADSRRYQNDVSTKLAGQVLAALYELLRGFQAADDHTHGVLLRDVLNENPDLVYEGLLTVLLRLVFLLFAEDRDLMPVEDVYALHYSVGGLFDRLRADAGRYPDTMDLRYGAWAQLLSVFRLVFDGVRFGTMHLPPRHGHLFDPDRFAFLEGRTNSVPRLMGECIDAPLVSDGVVWRVLQNLLVLDGERLSYRSLDVEQIGSVYETMMGFKLEIAGGHSLALRPAKPHGAPITINVDELLATQGAKRGQWVREHAEQKLTPNEMTALAGALTLVDVEAAIKRKVDRRATPNAVPAGAMILQPNEERRRSGSFYTPRSLTEPIVRTTLQPIFERLGDNPTPEAVLELKLCDPAMGSGAFLVEACRQLADKLIEAWHSYDCVPTIPPDSDELVHARRLVAHRCLYGVDRNPIAVDLAKLSLWLATLARDHAFTFLDHALRCGDSLVGLTRDQIVTFHWQPSREKDFITRSLLQAKVDKAEQLRAEIRDAVDDVSISTLHLLLREADSALDDLRLAGDLVVLAFVSGASQRERQAQRDRLAQQVWAWQQGGDALTLQQRTDQMRAQHHLLPFHWQIEFPEVFDRENPGFDGAIGNPPFLGGRRISTTLGASYLRLLSEMYPPAGDLCDLVAYFFRRVFSLLRTDGYLGLLATNTIAQGDTREGGLVPILDAGGSIAHATRRLPWPGSVSVVVSIVHIKKGHLHERAILDGRPCERISAYLVPGSVDHSPARLRGNPYYSSGSKIYGQGFLFDDSDPKANPVSLMTTLLIREPRLSDRILPYMGGDEVNASPRLEAHRYVIYLSDIAEESDLAEWEALAKIVREKVKPGREILSNTPSARALKRRWWAYQAHRPELYTAVRQMSRVLVNSHVSTHLAFAFLGPNFIYSHRLVVILLEPFSAFGVLQSRVHELWARRFSSTLGDALNYSPEDCFATFPFPTSFESDNALEQIAESYYIHRSDLMLVGDEGLTKIYNRFHDPNETSAGVFRLRELHDQMDQAVLRAYGWEDLWRPCEFLLDFEPVLDAEEKRRSEPWRYRWSDDVSEAVLARLLALNAQRAESERLQLGDHPTRSRTKTVPLSVASAPQLFEET